MDPTELAFAGIARQAQLIQDGATTPRALVELSLERIRRIDPQLNAVRVTFAEQALAAADAAQAALDAGRGTTADRPLLGVPVLIKDDVDVAGVATTYGSAAYGRPPAEDAEVVRRLRAAGAIVVGKTHTPELMQWPFTESATWGVTRNPWDPERSPGGSSGGSGAAVAAGLAGAALATDGAGSIRIPAACCGLFGLKPTRGLVPSDPYEDQWHGLSTIGCVTRTVLDTALYLDVVGDQECSAEPLTAAATRDPRRLRIACSTRNPLLAPLRRQPRAAYEQTIELLRELGHTLERVDPPYGADALPQITSRYLRGIHDDARALPHPERLERRTKGMTRLAKAYPPPVLRALRGREEATRARLDAAVFTGHDVLLTPALADLPLRVGRYQGRGALWTFNGVARFTPYTPPWNVTGHPAAAVPAGFTDTGLPLSVQLVGRSGDEATLIALAAQLEAARPWAQRRPSLAV